MPKTKRHRKSRPSVALASVRKFFPNVKKVSDADDDAFVEVTTADVKASAKKDHNKCAMAVAAKRQFHAHGIVISPSVAYVVKHDKATRFMLPASVQKEVVSFDRGAGFAEGSYELHRPPKTSRIGYRHTQREEDKRSNHLNRGKRKFFHATTGIRAVLRGKKRD